MRYAYLIFLVLTLLACQSKEEILTKSTWFVVSSSFNGKPLKLKTHDFGPTSMKNDSDRIEVIRFTKQVMVLLPGINSPSVPYDWSVTADGFELHRAPMLAASPTAEQFDHKALSDALALDSTTVSMDGVALDTAHTDEEAEIAKDSAGEGITMASFSFGGFSGGPMEEALKIYPETLQADIVNDTLYLRGPNLVIKAVSLEKVLE